MTKPKKSKGPVWDQAEEMLRVHREHAGVYRRVANRLKVDPSFVSRVARGARQNEDVQRALIEELSALQAKHLSIG